jgi:hypothetical protein
VDFKVKIVRDCGIPSLMPQSAPVVWFQVVEGHKPADVLPLKTTNGKLKVHLFNVGDLVYHTAQEAHEGGLLKKDACEEVLIKLIMHVIAPQSWSPVGGAGTIDFFPLGRTLVVSQTPEVQEQVAELLAGLRRFKAQQVARVPPLPPSIPYPAMPLFAPNPIPTNVFTEPVLPPPAPPSYPTATPLPAPPVYACPVPPGVVMPPPPAPEHAGDRIKAIMVDGKARLELRCDGDTCAICEVITWKDHGHAIKITAEGKKVQVVSDAFVATADQLVDLNQDGPLVLEGHVRCCRGKAKQGAQEVLVADHIAIWLSDESVEYRIRRPWEALPAKTAAKSEKEAVKPASYKR